MVRNLEDVLHAIYRNINPPKKEVIKNTRVLFKVVAKIVKEIKNETFFADLYKDFFCGGSYFDHLKIGHPDEFDLDLLLEIPQSGQPVLDHSNVPGYVWVKFDAPAKLSDEFKMRFVDEKNYLSTKKIRAWMMGLATKAVNAYNANKDHIACGRRMELDELKITEAGPAVTIHLTCRNFNIDIDLVPCFRFGEKDWPTGGYKANPIRHERNFFIVPKSPKDQDHAERYWRLSFQQQERGLIFDKNQLKPILKLLKQLRDAQGHHSIASYYIKTMFLLEHEKHGPTYWYSSFTTTFFKMLKNYIEYIERGIPYFWNEKNDLLRISDQERSNIVNRLKFIHADLLQKQETEPTAISRYLGVELY